jgi:hypothetical protein
MAGKKEGKETVFQGKVRQSAKCTFDPCMTTKTICHDLFQIRHHNKICFSTIKTRTIPSKLRV